MKIRYKDTSHNPDTMSLRKSASITAPIDNNINQERPLKHDSQNLSFKGLSSSVSISKIVEEFGNEFGKSAALNFKNKIEKANLIKDSGVKIVNGNLDFAKDKSIGKRFIDLLKYPFVEMPLDIANSTLKTLKKIGLNTDGLLNKKILKDRRELQESISEVASIKKYFEIFDDKTEVFKQSHTRMSPLVSNYDSTIEKTFTRLVTGAIPAFYLANDAYNLSIYMNNNKELAKEEKKRRFRQESARIAITAGATFGVLKLFSKKANASESVTVALMSGLTFVSEIVGRKLAGTPILPVNKERAKRYFETQGKDKIKNDSNHNPETTAKPDKKGKEQGKLTLANTLKVLGGLVVLAFGIEKLTNIKSIKNALCDLNNKYKNLYTKDFTISRAEFNNHIINLNKNGFKGIAKKYSDIVKNQKGEVLNLGKIENKVNFTIIHQILTFPMRFAWSTIMFPYKGIVKPTFNALKNGFFKLIGKPVVNDSKTKEIKELDILKNSIQFLKKIEKDPDFKDKVNESIMSSLDGETKSSYSNANLNAVIKNTMSAITSGFLIADNYNLVMIDSKGKNKELAEQKAKERTIQRGVRLAYGAFLIKFLNDLFRGPFNRSLLGAQAVNVLYTVATETLERKSVGLPVKESTREGIKEKEQKHMQADGFEGAYYRFMAKLTGKKAISEKTKTK